MFQDSVHEQGDSEYESADDDIEIIDEVIQGENGSGEEPYPGVERQEGDGEETPSSPTTLDDDEDKKNPAYIPKRGMFYEHDDRIDPEDEVEEEKKEKEEKEKDKDKKKKVWKADASEKWGHDKFMEMEQTPKNEEELVAAYGYDIRNEDAAPRARRRRRYGRGPNKYTRSWKDEDAYVKPATAKPVPVKPGGKPGKSVKIEDSKPEQDYEEEYPSLKREKSMTEMKSSNRPEFKREKSAPEIRTNKLNRNSRERDEDSFRNRKSDGFYNNKSDFGGRGFGPNRGRGGRGGRGGFDGPEPFRGGRGTRGGFDDRGRGGGDRRIRDDRGYPDNDFRGRGRGGHRGRGRGENGVDKRFMEPGMGGKQGDLADEMNNLDIKDNDTGPDKQRGGMRYSQQRRGDRAGSDNSNGRDSNSLQEMYAEGIDPSLHSGPPSAPPFQNQLSNSNNNRLSHAGHGNSRQNNISSAPNNFIGHNQPILNYAGPQFPVGPAGAVPPSTLGLGPAVTAIPNLAGTITTGVGMPIMAAPDPMMIGDTFTDVRGGVTYFNPTAQNFLPQRNITKRAKAPIAIVDPSMKVGDNRSLPGESNLPSENSELTAAQ